MEAFIGTVLPWAPNFAPRGWAFCNGQLLAISQYSAVFALLGTAYGGNGTTNFALPNLQGRVPVGAGQSPGTSTYVLGQMSGSETVTLTAAQMPQHTHTLGASNTASANLTQAPPAGWTLGAADSYAGRVASPVQMYNAAPVTAPVQSAPTSVAGNSTPTPVIQPYLVLNYIICLEGIFPSRN